jgi:hypothetical protein
MKLFELIECRWYLIRLWLVFPKIECEAVRERAVEAYFISATAYNSYKYWWLFSVNPNLR